MITPENMQAVRDTISHFQQLGCTYLGQAIVAATDLYPDQEPMVMALALVFDIHTPLADIGSYLGRINQLAAQEAAPL